MRALAVVAAIVDGESANVAESPPLRNLAHGDARAVAGGHVEVGVVQAYSPQILHRGAVAVLAALASRDIIGQAKSMIMERDRIVPSKRSHSSSGYRRTAIHR